MHTLSCGLLPVICHVSLKSLHHNLTWSWPAPSCCTDTFSFPILLLLHLLCLQMSSQLDSEDFKLSHWLLMLLLPHTVLFLLGTSLYNDRCLLPTFCLHLLSLFFNYLPFPPIYGNFLSLNFLPVLNKGVNCHLRTLSTLG